MQKTELVPQLQFIDVVSIRCELAATSSSSFQREGLSRVFAFLRAFSDFVHLDVESRLSADFLRALDA